MFIKIKRCENCEGFEAICGTKEGRCSRGYHTVSQRSCCRKWSEDKYITECVKRRNGGEK